MNIFLIKHIIIILLQLSITISLSISNNEKVNQAERSYWVDLAWKISQPVLENMAKGELQKKYDYRIFS